MVFAPVAVLLVLAGLVTAGVEGRGFVVAGVLAFATSCALHTIEVLRRTDRSVRHRAERERRPPRS